MRYNPANNDEKKKAWSISNRHIEKKEDSTFSSTKYFIDIITAGQPKKRNHTNEQCLSDTSLNQILQTGEHIFHKTKINSYNLMHYYQISSKEDIPPFKKKTK
ncbi:unnamed protein product [Rotaria sp. Silwood1]|nr:unnamed protein product [Rotaria sp. Silwood1]